MRGIGVGGTNIDFRGRKASAREFGHDPGVIQFDNRTKVIMLAGGIAIERRENRFSGRRILVFLNRRVGSLPLLWGSGIPFKERPVELSMNERSIPRSFPKSLLREGGIAEHLDHPIREGHPAVGSQVFPERGRLFPAVVPLNVLGKLSE